MNHGSPRIAIIGAGFGGIAAARELRRAGFDDLTIFDAGSDIGGTWRANTYPGAECDIPSHLYSFSFRLNGRWTRKWSEQDEILSYLQDCVRHFDLGRHMAPGTHIESCTFDDDAREWRVCGENGLDDRFDVVIFATGQLSRPRVPDIPGLRTFSGACFHSSRWRHDVALEGRRVAVIGNAASGVQLVPQVAALAQQVTVYQRSANWMLKKGNRDYLQAERWLATHVPGVARAYRAWIWLYAEALVYPLTGGGRLVRRLAEWLARRHMRGAVADSDLRERLTPDYPMGARRILFADGYYEALTRDNVDLVDTAIARVGEDYVEDAGGIRRPADAIVFATGFHSNDFLLPVRVIGRGGVALGERWQKAPQALYGIAAAGLPNLFMLYGPNTNLGHSSIVMMLECQARYIAKCLRYMREQGHSVIELRRDVAERFDREIQQRLARKIWASVASSWYLRDGRNTNNWPGGTLEYWWRTRRMNPADFLFDASRGVPLYHGGTPIGDLTCR